MRFDKLSVTLTSHFGSSQANQSVAVKDYDTIWASKHLDIAPYRQAGH